MSRQCEILRAQKRRKESKLYYIEAPLRKHPEAIRYGHSIGEAIHELMHPADRRLTPLSAKQIEKDLEDLGFSYPYL